MQRTASISRETTETNITLTLSLDGSGTAQVNTGIGFFDHMLVSFARHGFFDLTLQAQGDLYVDGHHTIEDTGIVLGQAIKQAVGDKRGIRRYGSQLLPMDETLVLCAVDLCGRPYLDFQSGPLAERVGYLETEMVREFFYAISYSAGMNLHLRRINGQSSADGAFSGTESNSHHVIEAMFKAFARALDEATTIDPRLQGVLSAKGSI